MRRFVLTILGVLIPMGVLALDYVDRSSHYSDAPFSRPEAAAISVLTDVGAVQGYPNGTFGPRRFVNRAEFVKIVLLSSPTSISTGVASNCFPDVKVGDWFSEYVCAAKKERILGGYPDGLFHPERIVNYAEALKILTRLHGYSFTKQTGDVWYSQYLRAAQEHQTYLPESIDLASSLTRGQMARLAAAFLSESKGELDLYRRAERGEAPSRSSSSLGSGSSEASSSARSSVSSISSSSSSSPAVRRPDLPVRSRFLMFGEKNIPIASAAFFSANEPAIIRSVNLEFKAEVESIDALYVLDADGVVLGQLTLDIYDTDKLLWKGTFLSSSSGYIIPQNGQRTLVVEARMKTRDNGGRAEELIQADSLRISVEGGFSHETFTSAPQSFTFPKHQTTQGNIKSVTNVLPSAGTFPLGTSQLLAAFSFSGSAISPAAVRIENIEFQVSKSGDVAVTNWQLGTPDNQTRVSCSVIGNIISCDSIPVDIGTVGSSARVLRLFGDVTLDQGARDPYIEVDLFQPGTVGENGAIRWTDGTGHYTWTELPTPIAHGTRWQ